MSASHLSTIHNHLRFDDRAVSRKKSNNARAGGEDPVLFDGGVHANTDCSESFSCDRDPSLAVCCAPEKGVLVVRLGNGRMTWTGSVGVVQPALVLASPVSIVYTIAAYQRQWRQMQKFRHGIMTSRLTNTQLPSCTRSAVVILTRISQGQTAPIYLIFLDTGAADSDETSPITCIAINYPIVRERSRREGELT